MTADVRYAVSGDLEVAYASYGDGEQTIVLIPVLLAHLDCNEEIPYYRPFVERFREEGRLVILDKLAAGSRGRGGSARPRSRWTRSWP